MFSMPSMPTLRLRPTLIATALFTLSASALASQGYYRFPAVSGETLAFTAEGDLWIASTQGGQAHRLTTDEGQETQASFSPDGTRIAFIGQYDGAGDVYVVSARGGPAKRLSFDGGRVDVLGWSPQGEVAYSSEDVSAPTLRRIIRLVNPDTLATRELPLDDANQVAFDDNGRVLFTRFGAHVNGDNAKHYRGGAMAQLWLYDPATGNEAQRLGSDGDGAMSNPLWLNGRWYFTSNRDGNDNLWSMAADGSDMQQHTQHAPWDVRGARSDGKHISFQVGADVWLFDANSKQERKLSLDLLTDSDRSRQRWLERPLKFLETTDFSPQGDQLALTARGHITLVSTGQKRRVEIATPNNSRARAAILSHDGRWVYAISDASGRDELWRYPADGSNAAKQLTQDGSQRRWQLYLSPNGKQLAHTDKTGSLYVLDLDSGRNTRIDRAQWGGGNPYDAIVWSPDGKALIAVRPDSKASRPQLMLYRFDTATWQALTSDRYESYAPSFSPDGRWLYFLSDRQFNASPSAPWGDRNMGPGFNRRTKVYALALQAGNRFPFAPVDELNPSKKSSADKNNDNQAALPLIETTGLAERLFEVPVDAGNYSALGSDRERLYLLDQNNDERQLKTLAIGNEGKSPEVFASDVRDFQLSANRKQLAITQGKRNADPSFLIVDAGAKLPSDLGNARVRTGDWRLQIEPKREWQQILNDAWRMHREFSFDSKMRGLDWNGIRERSVALLPRVSDRAELDDLLAQMISPLGILHSQVRGADLPEDREAAKPAMLGAALQQTNEGLKITQIYRTDRELPSERAPLAQPGVDARNGDIIEQVNGRSIQTEADLSAALDHQAGQQILLTLRRNAQRINTVAVATNPARNTQLRYSDWVQGRKDAVERRGQGRIGYLHLRAMGPDDIASFVRDFYANYDRDGLIIDVRRNRGGNIDSWIIEKLLRRTWAFWKQDGQVPNWNMQQTFRGHLVVLTDALTYSDGETFAAGVKSLGLGPVIGTRTSGAGIWLSDRNRLSDGGIARIAETGQFAPDGSWLIEGRGVSPDIEVDNLPHESYLGRDRQLETALQWLQKTLQTSPVQPPNAQPIPAPNQPAADAKRLPQAK